MKKRIALAFGLFTAVSVTVLTLPAFLQSQAALRISLLREPTASLDKTSLHIGLILEEIKSEKTKTMDSLVEHHDSEELPGLVTHVHGFDKIACDPNNPANCWGVVFGIPDSALHDLRAPRRAIDGFSQAVAEDWADRLHGQAKDYLNRVRAATQRMGDLIDDMPVLARVPRAELQYDTVDLSALAAEVCAELQKGEPQCKVDCLIQSDLGASGDARLLRMAMTNLPGHAWKYTSPQAHPRIAFGRLRNVSGNPEFYVRDNGAGFDMAYAGKLSGAFRRLHRTGEFPGTGVDLATVQRIIHRHGGQIRGEGKPGEGAVFYFTLPAGAFPAVTEAVHV